MILWQKGQSEERAYVSTSKSVSSFFFPGLRLMGSMNVVASTAASVRVAEVVRRHKGPSLKSLDLDENIEP